MNYVITRDDNSEELLHYGVLGMKWGVRRGNVQKAYEKASKKLSKYDSKITKYQGRATKHMKKADTHWYGRDVRMDLADRNKRKASKNMRKAEKWAKSMEKVFKNTTISMTQEQINIGRKYAESLTTRSRVYEY